MYQNCCMVEIKIASKPVVSPVISRDSAFYPTVSQDSAFKV